jgi:MFS transporter, ACS family, tartrate transporter
MGSISLPVDTNSPVEKKTIKRLYLRLIPFLIISYFINYIDRSNLSFAALEMNADIGLSETVFGLGAGLFFVTYVVFEVPSNLILEKVGARKWIARIMITWGIISGCMAFVHNDIQFYIVRILLGVAEAGFFPGMLFYLSLWFPAKNRASIQSVLLFAVPFSVTLGAPISGVLLGIDAFGLVGWQLMFVAEAIPAVLIGIATLIWLTDRPEVAKWLPSDEKKWLISTLAQEKALVEANSKHDANVWKAMLDWRVWALIVGTWGLFSINTGIGTFLPLIIKDLGKMDNLTVTLITAIPYAVSAALLIVWSRHSDKTRERGWHAAGPLAVAAIGLVLSLFVSDPVLKLSLVGLALVGLYISQPVFWTLPLSFVTGAAAAGVLALINGVGNIAGFVSPYVIGAFKDSTGSYDGGMLFVAVIAALGAMAMLLVNKFVKPVEALADQAEPGREGA